jgi:hypothetical protein
MNTEDHDPLPGVRDAAMSRLRKPEVLAAVQQDPDNAYETRVFFAAAEVVSLFEELQHTLQLLARITTFEELTAVLKLYIIGWISLSDLLADLLNQVYDLGIASPDVRLAQVLRNRHVQASGIPATIKRHAKPTDYDSFKKQRNDIVHRGKLEDDELISIRHDWLMALLRKAQAMPTADDETKQAAAAAASDETRTRERVRELIAARQSQYRRHLNATRDLLRDVAQILIPEIRSHK